MNLCPLPLRVQRGFTLIELLVVIAIIGLLAAFLFPAVKGAYRAAQTNTAKSNVRQVVAATLQFKDDNGLYFPGTANNQLKTPTGGPAASLIGGSKGKGDRSLDPERALYKYLKDVAVFESPSDRGAKSSPPGACANYFEEHGSSFLYVGNNVADCGLLGMNGVSPAKGRKYTDPALGASSLKILFYEPCFFGSAGKIPKDDPQAQWHDQNRSTVAGFLDGHAEMVRKDANKTVYGGGANVDNELRLLGESKRPYY
jgi:general secretion pathway protein G